MWYSNFYSIILFRPKKHPPYFSKNTKFNYLKSILFVYCIRESIVILEKLFMECSGSIKNQRYSKYNQKSRSAMEHICGFKRLRLHLWIRRKHKNLIFSSHMNNAHATVFVGLHTHRKKIKQFCYYLHRVKNAIGLILLFRNIFCHSIHIQITRDVSQKLHKTSVGGWRTPLQFPNLEKERWNMFRLLLKHNIRMKILV